MKKLSKEREMVSTMPSGGDYIDYLEKGRRFRERYAKLEGSRFYLEMAQEIAKQIGNNCWELEAIVEIAISVWYSGNYEGARDIWVEIVKRTDFNKSLPHAHAKAMLVLHHLSDGGITLEEAWEESEEALKSVTQTTPVYQVLFEQIHNKVVKECGNTTVNREVVRKSCARQKRLISIYRQPYYGVMWDVWLRGYYMDMAYAYPLLAPWFWIMAFIVVMWFDQRLIQYLVIDNVRSFFRDKPLEPSLL